ncbi:MAG TPA: RNB domain-containing ribonuclease [Pseudonocardiaceae bacterium]|jgi:exoribonuclease R|nr:RNB domain-containing ribonuclease [Pseudonocardiaceae bacterium]
MGVEVARGVRDFAGLRAEFGLPADYPTAALVEAEQAVSAEWGDREDATELPLVTIDPPGAKDLDQAMLVRRRPRGGFRLDYAIADAGHFVRPGGALDTEARRRGQTLFLPDGAVPLHPALLAQDAASLLPEEVRPAVLWTVDCDADGEPENVRVRRAVVRSVEQFDFDTVRGLLAAGAPHPSFAALPEFGRLRREHAVNRGAVELQLPEQQVVADGDGGWRLVLRSRVDVEAWNAELSLLTGMAAASLMLSAGIGVLRTLPEADTDTMASLRRRAHALGIDWPAEVSATRMLADLDPAQPEALAFHVDATRLLRGAGYSVLDAGGGVVAATTGHAGLGAAYTHVTAPLRRLVDRFAAEVCLAVGADAEVPEWVRAALPELPGLMATSDSLATRVERSCVAQVESWLLADRIGEVFPAVVLHAEARGGEIFVADPPVLAKCVGGSLPEGERISVRLVDADPVRRKVTFVPEMPPAVAGGISCSTVD